MSRTRYLGRTYNQLYKAPVRQSESNPQQQREKKEPIELLNVPSDIEHKLRSKTPVRKKLYIHLAGSQDEGQQRGRIRALESFLQGIEKEPQIYDSESGLEEMHFYAVEFHQKSKVWLQGIEQGKEPKKK